MNGSGCKTCPVNPCETMNYRGSTCAAKRTKYGLGDPTTNAGRIRAMSDEELAELIVKHKPLYSWPKAVREIWMQRNVTKVQAWVMWLQQPAEGE